MLDRTTTNAIIAAHSLAGKRAELVRIVARMHGATKESVEYQADALRDGMLTGTYTNAMVVRQIEAYEAAWARAKQGQKAKGGR